MLVLLAWLAEEEAHDTRTRNYTNVLELVQFVHCLLLQWPGRNSTVEIHTVSWQNFITLISLARLDRQLINLKIIIATVQLK